MSTGAPMRASPGLILLFVLAFPANAFASGMYLCRSPVIASNLWNDVITAGQAGVHLNKVILKNIADKNECPMVLADSFKPINFVAGQLLLTDGYSSGWANPYYYIIFVNRKSP
jgi:hypothetical protein